MSKAYLLIYLISSIRVDLKFYVLFIGEKANNLSSGNA